MDITKDLEQYDQYLKSTISKDILDTLKARASHFAVDMYNLQDEVARQAAFFGYIANLCVVQTKLYNAASLALDTLRAQLVQQIRQAHPKDGRSQGGITLDAIDATVKTNPRYLQQLVEVKNLEDELAHLRADEGASRQKSKMLEIVSQMMNRENRLKPYMKREEEEE